MLEVASICVAFIRTFLVRTIFKPMTNMVLTTHLDENTTTFGVQTVVAIDEMLQAGAMPFLFTIVLILCCRSSTVKSSLARGKREQYTMFLYACVFCF